MPVRQDVPRVSILMPYNSAFERHLVLAQITSISCDSERSQILLDVVMGYRPAVPHEVHAGESRCLAIQQEGLTIQN